MNNPNVTIIVANHNYGCWLTEAVDSVYNDKYPNVNKRVVIFDDASTDDSVSIAKNICDKYSGAMRVDLLASPVNNGPSFSRNEAIKYSWNETDLYAILDADDYFINNKLQVCVNKWLEDPMAICGIYNDYHILSLENNTLIRQFKYPYSKDMLMRECIIHSQCVISKEALAQVGLYDEELRVAEDFDLWLRLSERYVFIHIPESLSIVRVGKHDSSNSVDKKIWEACHQRVMQKVVERQNLNGQRN